MLTDLPVAVFGAGDSLGWVYQFWQAKRKEEVNKSGNKIGADELSAVTQLFTEHYMVEFLLHNSLGSWWVSRHGELPGDPLRFLRRDEQGKPAAGSFGGWPETVKELRVIDPCCGSGHFLVAAFEVLVRMRMVEEGIPAREACDGVLRENVFGVELDQRCTQIAAFALAMAAWRFPGAGGYRELPPLNIACSGLSISAKREDWIALAGTDPRLKSGMARLFALFEDAPILGSLIDPTMGSDMPLLSAEYGELEPLLAKALEKETGLDPEKRELGITAQGIAAAARFLGGRYHLVVTNVPYLARGKQSDPLREFCQDHHSDAKTNLATVFVERCVRLCGVGGSLALVTPQEWLFLDSYKHLRKRLLQDVCWNWVVRLGTGAFETISGEVVNVTMLALTRAQPMADQMMWELDASDPRSVKGKAESLTTDKPTFQHQIYQLKNPDSRIAFGIYHHLDFLSKFANSYQGIKTSDDPQFVRKFWELAILNKDWCFHQSTVDKTCLHGGLDNIIYFQDGSGNLRKLASSQLIDRHRDQQGGKAWGFKGIAVSSMRDLQSSIYVGDKFDTNIAVMIPHQQEYLEAIWCFSESTDFNKLVRTVDQTLKVTNASLTKVPFDLNYWQEVAQEKYPNGLPQPYSNDPTQWIFHGHPCGSVIWDEDLKWTTHSTLRTDETVLHIAVARLLGYRWPAERDPDMELAQEQREWVNRCQALLSHADNDGIVCIPPIRGEQPAADRLRSLLVQAYGSEWTPTHLQTLLTQAGSKTLEDWLRNSFFEQHCKLFHHRPFIWQIWDGRKDGFSVLVNHHKLDTKLLETLTYTYLGDWIRTQQYHVDQGTSGADAKLLAAQQLQKKLELILEGEDPYDIFVRWKPLEQQPIGWDPDLNDGVRLN
ncbi:MAG: N-6 DNA methylase, partial [Synechococcaceae cyanobacterium SM2_3_2]|nr:N-6 DNA methylase [Synechococcaceae cyanobacterium SM2_3_2]